MGYPIPSSLPKGVYNPKTFIPHAASLRQAFAHCAIFLTAASRRSLARVAVPVWLIVLSDQLPVEALVSRYLTNKLIGHEPIQERDTHGIAFLPEPQIQEAYAVLANLSASYSPLEGRLPMYSSPVRRFTNVLLHLLARLACIRRAASVRSEPGSNSHNRCSSNLDQGPPLQYTLHLAQRPLFSCQRTIAFITRAAHYTTVRSTRVKGPARNLWSGSFPRTAP